MPPVPSKSGLKPGKNKDHSGFLIEEKTRRPSAFVGTSHQVKSFFKLGLIPSKKFKTFDSPEKLGLRFRGVGHYMKTRQNSPVFRTVGLWLLGWVHVEDASQSLKQI